MTSRALVVGIPTTSYAGLPDLPGALTDVGRVERTLHTHKFEVRALHTPSPTCSAVKDGLTRLAAETLSGDLGVIYFSGHGYRIPDDNGDENDDWDEALVCADDAIVDDWFRDTLWSGVHPGSRFIVIVDACHGQTAAFGLAVEEDVPVPPLQPAPESGVWRLVLAACRDEKTTVDLGPGDEGGGVATKEMIKILNDQPDISHKDLWQRVATNVRNRYFERGVGTPHLLSSGPDDSLVTAAALTTGIDRPLLGGV